MMLYSGELTKWGYSNVMGNVPTYQWCNWMLNFSYPLLREPDLVHIFAPSQLSGGCRGAVLGNTDLVYLWPVLDGSRRPKMLPAEVLDVPSAGPALMRHPWQKAVLQQTAGRDHPTCREVEWEPGVRPLQQWLVRLRLPIRAACGSGRHLCVSLRCMSCDLRQRSAHCRNTVCNMCCLTGSISFEAMSGRVWIS